MFFHAVELVPEGGTPHESTTSIVSTQQLPVVVSSFFFYTITKEHNKTTQGGRYIVGDYVIELDSFRGVELALHKPQG